MFQLWHLFTLASIVYGVAGTLLLWKIPTCKRTKADRNCPAETLLISIIIPARNEGKRLPTLLQSLTAEKERISTSVKLEIIVVDDCSEDNTAEIAASFGAKVLSFDKTPKGKAGKSRACWKGAQLAKGATLLFLDADTWFAPGGLHRIISCLKSAGEHPGLISIQPYHVTRRLYESLSAYFNIIVMSGVNAFTPFAEKGRPKGCFGPCLICTREDYIAVGGHHAIADELVDDIALARLFLRRGLPVYCYGGRGTIEFRMYPGGIKDLIQGWTKNMATGAKFSSLITNILLFVWIAGVTNLLLSLLRAVNTGIPVFIAGTAAVYILYSVQLFLHLRRIGKFFPLLSLFFPVYLLFFILLFLYSIVKTGFVKKVRWRGRDIRL